jgi:hypothetical protein
MEVMFWRGTGDDTTPPFKDGPGHFRDDTWLSAVDMVICM